MKGAIDRELAMERRSHPIWGVMLCRGAQWMVIGLIVAGCAPRTSAVPTRSARVVVPLRVATPAPLPPEIIACHGEEFCREMAAPHFDDEARADAAEECDRYRGRTSAQPCRRDGIVAVCQLAGEHGPLSVFAYAQHAADTMSDVCESAGGSYEVAAILR
jgi:hypothetical protein